MHRTTRLVTAAAALSFARAADAQTVIPTRYVADRFFAAPVTPQGDTLLLLMDTGGGQVFTTKAALVRMGITPKFIAFEQGDSIFSGGTFPSFRAGASIPPALGTPRNQIYGFAGSDLSKMNVEGMVGHNWFAGRVWVLDYPAHRVSYFEKPPAPAPFGPHTIPMTLKKPLTRDDPRIQVIVAGDTVDMLLDTGATSDLTPAALAAMGGGRAVRASAFVADRQWKRWRAAHPDWRVIGAGEATSHQDLIEVPNLTIAGYDTGPVWFAHRDNSAYDQMMNQLMDKPIVASVGGQAFRRFRLTMDYVNQRLTVEKP